MFTKSKSGYKMKILIVEDDSSSRLLLKKILKKDNYEIDVTSNGLQAWEALKKTEYDAVITDWMMPQLDGIELISKIRKSINPAPVIIMITALASQQALDKAMSAGADDFITKPIDIEDVKRRLENSLNQQKSATNIKIDSDKIEKPDFKGVCIATSTGGPQTLLQLFEKIEPTNKASFFIVLHGPAWMLKAFPKKIKNVCKMKVELAENEMQIEPGKIYLAPGEIHTMVDPENMTLQLVDSPPENFVKPSADPLFKSAAKLFGSDTIGIVLTGMGHDGSIGAGFVKASDGFVIAQDPESAILPSMPSSVIELRIQDKIAHLDQIAEIINKKLNN